MRLNSAPLKSIMRRWCWSSDVCAYRVNTHAPRQHPNLAFHIFARLFNDFPVRRCPTTIKPSQPDTTVLCDPDAGAHRAQPLEGPYGVPVNPCPCPCLLRSDAKVCDLETSGTHQHSSRLAIPIPASAPCSGASAQEYWETAGALRREKCLCERLCMSSSPVSSEKDISSEVLHAGWGTGYH